MRPTKDAPAFDFFPERFWHAVEGWSNREIVQYMRLLSHQWTQDGITPRDLRSLARGKLTERVIAKFPLAADGKLRNLMLEGIREQQRERIASRRLGSIITNASRYGIDKLSEEDRAILNASGKTVDPAPPKDKKTKTETHERGEYPDLSEYPELDIVKAWADSVMVPPECAEKWHAEQVAAQWLNRNRVPLSPKASALRPLFNVFATGWKSFQQRGPNGKPRRSDFDMKPKNQTENADVEAF